MLIVTSKLTPHRVDGHHHHHWTFLLPWTSLSNSHSNRHTQQRPTHTPPITPKYTKKPFVEPYPFPAGTTWTYAEAKMFFEQKYDAECSDLSKKWSSFGDKEHWQLTDWILHANLTQSDCKDFFNLKTVSGIYSLYCLDINNYSPRPKNQHLKWKSKNTVLKAVDDLESGPKCHLGMIPLKDNTIEGEPVVETLELWWRDVVYCMFDTPIIYRL